MELEFAKYTDVTKLAKKVDSGFYGEYEKILICPDTNNFWVAKILKGYDGTYERNEDVVLIERNNIDDFSAKDLKIYTASNLAREVLTSDSEDGSNWDNLECESVEEALEEIDSGFGIIEEDD